ncbi:hypothetical protein KM1_321000 [Entamoeba histolytica HM-3:IMSS]|nr:hypothetical protein KM1_321000 [Entamoeba histolytica HM-3:IMSS]
MTQLQELKMGINDIEFNPNTISSVREKVESTLESLKFEDCVVSDLEDSSSEEE